MHYEQENEASSLSNRALPIKLSQRERQNHPEQQHQLLTPKLHPPRPRSFLIQRAHLLAQLDRGLEYKLTLVSAPAGYGKTTLLGTWITRLSQHGGPSVAWLSLDEGDNDPARFWHYVISACQSLHPALKQVSPVPSSMLQAFSFDYEQVSVVITSLLNSLHELRVQGVLVLEDYHTISTPLIHQSLGTLLDRLPPHLHLIILTRNNPPLPLARLRASHELHEIQAADLRFSVEETTAFIEQRLSLSLPREAARQLTERTEGWAVGTQLAALALQGHSDPQEIEHILTSFTGSHRHVMDYLVTEVLNTLPEPLQVFLLQTSSLQRLTPALCNAVTERTDSQAIVEQLEVAHLFLTAIDEYGQWYRYHALFAEAMRTEARRRYGENFLHECALRASSWYEAHAMLTEAIESALFAHAFERAATLIENSARHTFRFNGIEELYTLQNWLMALPGEILQAHPQLCFSQAIVLLFTLDRHAASTQMQVEVPLRQAERRWQAEGNQHKLGETLAFRSLIVGWRDDLALSFTLAHQALALLPQTELLWRGISLITIGKEAQIMGRLNDAQRFLTEAYICCETTNTTYALLACSILLGNVCFAQGELQQAARYYQRVVDIVGEPAHAPSTSTKKALDDWGLTRIGLAQLAYERDQLELAEQQVAEGLAIGEQLHNEYLCVSASLLLARIWQAGGENEQAQQLLQDCAIQSKTPEHLYALELEQARLAISQGDLTLARRILASHPDNSTVTRSLQEQQALLLAHIHIAQGQIQEALTSLHYWLAEADEMGHGRSVVQILAITALAHQANGNLSQAKRLVLQALALARPAGLRRVFLDEGEKMLILLHIVQRDQQEEPLRSYLRTLTFATTETSANAILSPQELRVLRLLAAGYSRPQMAEELVVSVNTIKTQLHNIYHKLNAVNRKEACARARHLQLL